MKNTAFLLILLLTSCVQSPHYKIAYLDTACVYHEAKQSQSIQRHLEQTFGARREALAQMRQEVQSLKNQLERETSSSKRAQIKPKFDSTYARYVEEERRFIDEYTLSRNEAFVALQKSAMRVMMQIREQEGYNWILDQAIVVDKKFDITDQVVDSLNKQYNP